MTDTIVYSRPAGGYWFHIRVEQGSRRQFVALCGFAPGSAYTTSRRGKWGLTQRDTPSRTCPKCAKRLSSQPTQESFA